jgi:hypothetical protein
MVKSTANRLHEAMHGIPGVPSHESAAHVNSNEKARRRHDRHARSARSHGAHPSLKGKHGEPRVLIAWQRWIADLPKRVASR